MLLLLHCESANFFLAFLALGVLYLWILPRPAQILYAEWLLLRRGGPGPQGGREGEAAEGRLRASGAPPPLRTLLHLAPRA